MRRLERINRDLEELENFQNTIRDDRDYANRLRNSLIDESLRLDNLKGKIFSQIIKSPPEELVHKLGGIIEKGPQFVPKSTKSSGESVESVETRHPDKAKKSSENTIVAQPSGPQMKIPEAKGEDKTTGSRDDQKKGAPYRFVYTRPGKTPN